MDFEEYALAHAPGMTRLATALSGDHVLAQDLVQEVLIKMHRRWVYIDGLDAREAYVRRMLVNELLSWRRKWARVLPFADVIVGAEPDPSVAHAERDLLRREVSRLPRRQQIVLALRYYGGLSDTEIADALGCAVSTVRAYASRALATLRIDPALNRSDKHRELTAVKEEPAR